MFFFTSLKFLTQSRRKYALWTAMEDLVYAGLVKNIGIRSVQWSKFLWSLTRFFSNAQGGLILDIAAYARIEPQVLQIELHPYLTQEPLLKLADILGIAVTAVCSFGPQVRR